MPNHDVITFGCRLNAYESEVIRGHLAASSLDDVTVFNTCAVTKEAERQAMQQIRRHHRENPKKKLIITGCGAQIDPLKYSDLPGVIKVLGNDEKLTADAYDFANDSEPIAVNDIMSVKETAGHLIQGLEGKSRAFLQVQNGCNHRCTFCIIPYGRGNSRSVPMGEIVAQTKLLVEQGVNEIVITGVDISDYGKDLPGTPTLGQMMKRLLALVPNLPRLRLSSIDVAEIDDDLLHLIAHEPRLMPHLHLSLQAGDDMILKRMKRRHNREQVLDFVTTARRLRPDMVFGADIIAGFPTESDAMFENTLNIVHEADLIHLHIFPYSEREGTPAAAIPASKQVPKNIRKARAKALREAGEKQLQTFLQSRIGQREAIVMEQDSMGHTEHFASATLDKKHDLGSLVHGTVTAVNNNQLVISA